MIMKKQALVAGLEEFFGEAAGIDDVELVDCAVFLNSRRRDWVDDFGNGVSRLEERVIACNENGRLDCVTLFGAIFWATIRGYMHRQMSGTPCNFRRFCLAACWRRLC
jgi:hypothetical protein